MIANWQGPDIISKMCRSSLALCLFLIANMARSQNIVAPELSTIAFPGGASPVLYGTGARGTVYPVRSAEVYVGGVRAKLHFAGLTPGYIGLGQANFEVPNLAPGDYELTLSIGDRLSNTPVLSIAR